MEMTRQEREILAHIRSGAMEAAVPQPPAPRLPAPPEGMTQEQFNSAVEVALTVAALLAVLHSAAGLALPPEERPITDERLLEMVRDVMQVMGLPIYGREDLS